MIIDEPNKSNERYPIMNAFANILIYHPAAIGDSLLATPVTKTLKLNFPAAKITYWGHSSVRQLFGGFCPWIDEFIDYSKEQTLLDLFKTVSSIKPDLFIDLSNSNKGIWLSLFVKAREYLPAKHSGWGACVVLTYIKNQSADNSHATKNFLQTIEAVC
jgi:ADP-heptose:LPS heptosyltransferase